MSRRVGIGVRIGALVLAAQAWLALPATAQTTVVLSAPGSDVVDTTIRGGAYATLNMDTAPLVTRASSDSTYVRRALLKFDTENRVPAGVKIQSATLTLTVRTGNPETRTVDAYRIAASWDASTATWDQRWSGAWWSTAGSDLGGKVASATVTPTAGSKVTFDVTPLVQNVVNGNYGSRYTRIALVDQGSASNDSYKEYYNSEWGDSTKRPKLTVVYGGSSTSSSTTSTSSSLPSSWASTDIGSVGATGSGSGDGKSFSVSGAGADIWGSADAFRFTYTTLSGDGSVVTQVQSLDILDSWTKAGVMMRDSLSSGARQASMFVSAGNGYAFQRRTSTGGSSDHTAGGSGYTPGWVKLTRSGTTFTAYRSSDGSSWTRIGSDTIGMGQTVYVGVAVTSHIYGYKARATFGSTKITAGSTSTTTTTTSSSSSSGSSSSVRVLQWNTHHGGIGTDGVYSPSRLAGWIARINPDVVSLNEVDTTTQVDNIVNSLQSQTGVKWYKSFSGLGNLLLSRLAPSTTSKCVYPDGVRYSAHLSVMVNGRPINIWSTHLTVDSASKRWAEIDKLQSCASNWPEARILAGDYNMLQSWSEYSNAASGYNDAWLWAKSAGTAYNYSGNCDGCTRGGRIDYVFTSKNASFLSLSSARIYDTRDSSGIMPSDHKPMLVIYSVK